MRRILLVVLFPVVALLLGGCARLQLEDLPAASAVDGPAYRVTAQFAEVGNLTVGAKVKQDGVVVGEVTSIRTRDFRAVVAMRIAKKYALPVDSAFQVRFTTPLGENYIAVHPPARPGPRMLADGALVPLARTAQAPTIEDTFAAVSLLLNGGGLDKLHTIVTELNQAMDGRTGSVRDALVQLRRLAAHLYTHTGDIDRALDGLKALATSLNRGTPVIERALTIFPDTLQALADDTAKLRLLVERVARLGDTVRDALGRGQQALLADLDALRPTLDALRSTDREIIPTIESLRRFGGLVQQAVPGDYVNLDLNVRFLFDVPPQLPSVPGTSQPSSDAVRTLLGGGLR